MPSCDRVEGARPPRGAGGDSLASAFGSSYPSRFGIRRIRARHLDLYREFYATATFETVSASAAFPLFLRANHGLAVIEGRLFLFRQRPNGDATYLNVVGLPVDRTGTPIDVAEALDILSQINGGPVGRIECVHPNLPAGNAPRKARPMAGRGVEYVYDNIALAELQGGTFRNLRKKANRFANRYRTEIVPFHAALRPAAEEIYARWSERAGARYERIWDGALVHRLLANHDDLDEYQMFLVRDLDRDRYIGLFDAFRVSTSLAIGILRKLDTDYDGIARYCRVWLARHLADRGCRFLNVGNDGGGVSGLVSHKMSYRPVATFQPVIYRARRPKAP